MKKVAFNYNPMATRVCTLEHSSYPPNLWKKSSVAANIPQRQHAKKWFSLCARKPRRTAKSYRLTRANQHRGLTGFAPSRESLSFFCRGISFRPLLQSLYSVYNLSRSEIGMLSCTSLVLPTGMRSLSSNAYFLPVCNDVRFGVISARLGIRWAFSFVQMVE